MFPTRFRARVGAFEPTGTGPLDHMHSHYQILLPTTIFSSKPDPQARNISAERLSAIYLS